MPRSSGSGRWLSCSRSWAALILLLSAAARGAVVSEPPARPEPNQSILFYLHGQIVEGSDGRPVHPELGPYEYRAIAETLSARGFLVVSEIRPAHSEIGVAAAKLAGQIEGLLAAGVSPRRIGVVGHSKGGMIARAVSSRLAEEELSYVVLAGCFRFDEDQPQALHGRILSLIDRSDRVAVPCAARWEGRESRQLRSETVLDLGGGHGLFYRPLPAWIDLVVDWLRQPGEGPAEGSNALPRRDLATID